MEIKRVIIKKYKGPRFPSQKGHNSSQDCNTMVTAVSIGSPCQGGLEKLREKERPSSSFE